MASGLSPLMTGFAVGFVTCVSIFMIILGGSSITDPFCLTDGLGILIAGLVLLGGLIGTILISVYSICRSNRERIYPITETNM